VTDEEREAKLRRVRAIARQLRRLEALQRERSDLFAELQAGGVTQAAIAKAAGCSPVAVHKVLAKRR
jgi:hypothetical protein